MSQNASFYISRLKLQPHPEGGFYQETYRAVENIAATGLPARFTGERSFYTVIYYLLQQGDYSGFHRIKSDECWHFYAGEPLYIHILENGRYTRVQLGSNLDSGEAFQYVVAANAWFASEPAPGSSFCLAGCSVAPGFDFSDFEMADLQTLLAAYPKQKEIIQRLCR